MIVFELKVVTKLISDQIEFARTKSWVQLHIVGDIRITDYLRGWYLLRFLFSMDR